MKHRSQLPSPSRIASAAATAATVHWTALAFGVAGPLVFQAIAIIALLMAIALASSAILGGTR